MGANFEQRSNAENVSKRGFKMFKLIRLTLLIVSVYLPVVLASAQTAQKVQPCTGFNPNNNVNLACEIPTAVQSGIQVDNSLKSLSPTLATQLSQLPNSTAITGSGLTFSRSLGVITASNESLGTILTQRGETIGRHKFFISFDYQRFSFSSIDGISLKHVPTVLALVQGASGSTLVDTVAQSRIDLLVDQFAAVGSFGVTSRLDLTVMVPFSKVTLKAGSVTRDLAVVGQNALIPVNGPFLAGSANGVGDISVNVKANVVNGEHTKIAVGGEVRFPTGDEANYLGTGAYGFKPYIVLSRAGRITPNINLGYQWNGASSLFVNPSSGSQQNLPSSFLYSGGVDFRAFSRLTLTTEFVGQAVINGPRLATTSLTTPVGSFPSVTNQSGTYTMDNIGVGFKFNPYKGFLITADTLFALDEGGLRSKVIPLVGVSYRF